jgi:predicted  nucleic acid-binding Zn-ribbon protein
VQYKDKIQKLEIEIDDVNERANSFNQLYENESADCQLQIEELNKENIRLKRQLLNLEETLNEFYQEQGASHSVSHELLNKIRELEEINLNLKTEMDQKLSKRNDIKDRNEEYAMKNEVLEKKINEL